MPHKRTPEGLAESMPSQPQVLVLGERHNGIEKPKLDQASDMLQATNSNPVLVGKK